MDIDLLFAAIRLRRVQLDRSPGLYDLHAWCSARCPDLPAFWTRPEYSDLGPLGVDALCESVAPRSCWT